MIETLVEWWRAGEQGAVHIYRQGIRSLVLVCIVSLFLVLFDARFRHPFLWPLYALAILRGLGERRRAIIFTCNSVVYRPPFARPRRTQLSEIAGVKEGYVQDSFLLRGILKNGIIISLHNGDEVGIPLDFPSKKQIAARFGEISPA